MQFQANISGVDLHLDLPHDERIPTRGRGARQRQALTSALRGAIEDGRLAAGTVLPPYRTLAADLHMSRGTVGAVYQDLIAEGWLVARQGSATRVAEGVTAVQSGTETIADRPAPIHNFLVGQPNSSQFPRAEWIAATRRALQSAPDSAFDPSVPHGSRILREELARYLARARGVRVGPGRIVLTTGVQSSLGLLARTVLGEAAAVESHSLPFHRQVIEEAGVPTLPVPVDQAGAVIDEIPARATAVLLSPSHQFPTGVALSPDRRSAVVDRARRTGTLIVEDDYDGEYRYDRDPVGALQSLGPDVTVYAGSVSKTLSTSVRIGWLVLPTGMVDRVAWAKGVRETEASIVDQLVLAELIRTGAYDRHIRRTVSSIDGGGTC